MARMAFAVARTGVENQGSTGELTLVAAEIDTRPDWSIDDEAMGAGWHDSSWMLRRGLDVIEGLPPGATPPDWTWAWWAASLEDVRHPA